MPKIIDVQHHFVPLELLARRGITPGERRNLIEGGIPKLTLHDKLYDMDGQLRDMDRAGIDLAVLSCNLGWDAPLEECRLINDSLAEIQRRYPGRFAGLAHAPVLEPAGLDEIARAAGEAGLRGVTIASQVNGLSLDAPRLAPFYRTACALDLAVFVHPAQIPAGYALFGEYDLARIIGREVHSNDGHLGQIRPRRDEGDRGRGLLEVRRCQAAVGDQALRELLTVGRVGCAGR